jgi:hypothetical protein
MATLIEWFAKKDYEEGLVLLAKHSKNRMLIQNLNKKKNPGKLLYELKKIATLQKLNLKKPAPVKQIKTVKKEEVKVKAEVNPGRGKKKSVVTNELRELKIVRGRKVIDPDQLPEEIKKLWEENRDMYKEVRALSEKCKLMEKASPEDRQPLTSRMLDLDDKIRVNWDVIDNWQPGKKEEKHEKIDHKRINANRKYISTNLKKLQAGVDESKAEIIRGNLQIRYEELKAAGEEVNAETIAELKKAGVN